MLIKKILLSEDFGNQIDSLVQADSSNIKTNCLYFKGYNQIFYSKLIAVEIDAVIFSKSFSDQLTITGKDTERERRESETDHWFS